MMSEWTNSSLKVSNCDKEINYNNRKFRDEPLTCGEFEGKTIKIKEEPINFIECGIQVKKELIETVEEPDCCDYNEVSEQKRFASHEILNRVHMENKSSSSCPSILTLPHHRTYKCNYCDYITKKISHLKVHERCHTGEKPYKCSECDFSSAVKSHLTVHIRRHTGEKPYKCTHCEFSATQGSKLKVHVLRNHSIEKPYNCSECNFRSANSASFKFHLQKHSGKVEKSFKCRDCNYTTSHRYYLKVHVRRHTGEKPYKCSQCVFSCATKSGLNYHITKH